MLEACSEDLSGCQAFSGARPPPQVCTVKFERRVMLMGSDFDPATEVIKRLYIQVAIFGDGAMKWTCVDRMRSATADCAGVGLESLSSLVSDVAELVGFLNGSCIPHLGSPIE